MDRTVRSKLIGWLDVNASASAAEGYYDITLTGTDRSNNTTTTDIYVYVESGFVLDANPQNLTIAPGSSSASSISAASLGDALGSPISLSAQIYDGSGNAVNGDGSISVTLGYCSGGTAGLTGQAQVAVGDGSSCPVTVNVGSGVALGSVYTVDVTGTDAGGDTADAQIGVTVESPQNQGSSNNPAYWLEVSPDNITLQSSATVTSTASSYAEVCSSTGSYTDSAGQPATISFSAGKVEIDGGDYPDSSQYFTVTLKQEAQNSPYAVVVIQTNISDPPPPGKYQVAIFASINGSNLDGKEIHITVEGGQPSPVVTYTYSGGPASGLDGPVSGAAHYYLNVSPPGDNQSGSNSAFALVSGSDGSSPIDLAVNDGHSTVTPQQITSSQKVTVSCPGWGLRPEVTLTMNSKGLDNTLYVTARKPEPIYLCFYMVCNADHPNGAGPMPDTSALVARANQIWTPQTNVTFYNFSAVTETLNVEDNLTTDDDTAIANQSRPPLDLPPNAIFFKVFFVWQMAAGTGDNLAGQEYNGSAYLFPTSDGEVLAHECGHCLGLHHADGTGDKEVTQRLMYSHGSEVGRITNAEANKANTMGVYSE